jgi:transposase-like protein
MAKIARKSDGRRIFGDEFKRKHLGRVQRGELTIAALSRELGIARSLLHRWQRLVSRNGDGDRPARLAAPISRLDTAQYIRELQLLVGKQTVELEMLRAEVAALRNGRRLQGLPRS